MDDPTQQPTIDTPVPPTDMPTDTTPTDTPATNIPTPDPASTNLDDIKMPGEVQPETTPDAVEPADDTSAPPEEQQI